MEDSMKPKKVRFLGLAAALALTFFVFLGCNPYGTDTGQTGPLDSTSSLLSVFSLKARLVAFADKAYVGWDEVPGAAGYKLYRNVGLGNRTFFGEEYAGSALAADNNQGSTDVQVEDSYVAAGYASGNFPKFIYYWAYAYDANGKMIAISNVAECFSHLPLVQNIAYASEIGKVSITWDEVISDTYTVLGYKIYRYDDSKEQPERNILLGTNIGATNTSFTVEDTAATRDKQWNYYIAPFDANGVSATEMGGRVYADLAGPAVTETHNAADTTITVSWNAVVGAIGYNVYLGYISGSMSGATVNKEKSNYNGTGSTLAALNGTTPVTSTSYTYNYDGPGVQPYATKMTSGSTRKFVFVVQAVSSLGESGNLGKSSTSGGVSITKP